MPSSASKLASAISIALKQSTVSNETKGMAEAIVEEISKGVISFAPGTITGVASTPGGQLSNGKGDKGKISSLKDTRLSKSFAKKMKKPFESNQLKGIAKAITTHIMKKGMASFSTGNVKGTCTHTASSPGNLIGQGVKGVISGLDQKSLANDIAKNFGGPPTSQVNLLAKAIINHIQKQAIVSFKPGSIKATISAGGGPIVAGSGAGGSISWKS